MAVQTFNVDGRGRNLLRGEVPAGLGTWETQVDKGREKVVGKMG